MFTGVNIGITLLLVEYDFAEKLQEELDNMLVIANLLGYEVEYVYIKYALFVNLKMNEKLLISVQFSHDKSMILNCVEVCGIGEKFDLMREKFKNKQGAFKSLTNYPKAIKKIKSLL